MRNKMKRFGKRVLLPAMAATIMTMASVSTKVYAAGGDGGSTAAVTKPLDNLKTLIIAVIGAVGVIILAKNDGVFTGISTAGFFYDEFCTERNRSRSYDGGHFVRADISWILRKREVK